MLDRLPPELLDKVLLLAAPPRHDYDTERNRQLVVFCGVSKRLHAQAQRLLWRDVHLEPDNAVNLFADALCSEPGEHLKLRIRTMSLCCQDDWSVAVELLPRLPNLVELTLVCDGSTRAEPPLEALPELPGLKRLNLLGAGVGGFGAASFPSVTSVYMGACFILDDDGELDSYVLEPAAFPSLRALSLRNLSNNDPRYFNPYAAISPGILEQLDALEVCLDWITDVLPADYLSPSVPAILELSVFDLANVREVDITNALPRHLHLTRYPERHGISPAVVCTALRKLASLLPSSPALFSLHLPSSLRHVTDAGDTLSALVQKCEEQGTEVIWNDEEGEFLPVFARYMREVREREREEGEGHQ
ncbi:hypothetical protein JCM10213_001452 [Rhodosporidiobolus nylandii]